MWILLMTTAYAASPARDAAVDALWVAGATYAAGSKTGAVVGLVGAAPCPGIDLDGPDPCTDAAAVGMAAGFVAGGIAGAAVGAIPARVRSGRVAVAGMAPGLVGLGIVAVGVRDGDLPLTWAGCGTILLGMPIASAIAAATDRQDRNVRETQETRETALALGFAPAPGGGQLAVAGRF